MNEEMKRIPRPANLRTGRTPIAPTSTTEKFLNLHIGEISFNAGDANGKLNINLRDGLDVEYNATTTEEKKYNAEEELTNKIGALFETLKSITPAPTTDTVTPNATPTPPTSPAPIPVPPIPTPSWNPWAYKPTCSQPGSGSEPKPNPAASTSTPTAENGKVVKKTSVAPASTNNTNNPNNTDEKPITRKEYKMLVNSMYGMQDTILELNRTIETCIRSIENFISANK